MCLVCVAASQPEIFVVMGGYAAARGAKPVQRIRGLFRREQDATEDNPVAAAVTDLEAAPAAPATAAPVRSRALRPELGTA